MGKILSQPDTDPQPPGKRDWRQAACFMGALLSGLMLALAFPPFEIADAAWCALVPLIIASASIQPAKTWRLGLVAGLAFWLVTIFWLTRVTYAGWMMLSAYCAAYTIPFVLFSAVWFRRFGTAGLWANGGYMILSTAVWVAMEYARANFLTGFPWNPIGASQFANLTFIQHASWGGVYIITALIVWTNVAIALTIMRYLHGHARLGRKPHLELMLGMAAVLVAFIFGNRMIEEQDMAGQELRLAVVQPSIPQDEKWDEAKVNLIYGRLRELTTAAISFTRPEMVIWPETALPFEVRNSESDYLLVQELAKLGTPILVGSMDSESLMDQKPRYYNSTFLFDAGGTVVDYYEKRHLVMFGEYVPFHEYVDIVNALTPVMESFSPGSTSTVFRLPGRDIPFSSLICFEDTLAYLGRDSVKNGARMLVNQTNDAWFDPLWGSRQHLVLSVFRAVENRVPLVRSANTGFSCAINQLGQIDQVLTGGNNRHDGKGFQAVTVQVPPETMPLTFYTRHGDVFAWSCLPLGMIALVFAWRDNRKARRPNP